MLVKGQKTTVLARSRSQISLTHVKNYFGAVNSAFFWFRASCGRRSHLSRRRRSRQLGRARATSLYREMHSDFARFIFHLNFFSSPKFEQQQFFLQWAEHSFLKQRHEVGRKANGGGQTKPIFFLPTTPLQFVTPQMGRHYRPSFSLLFALAVSLPP